MALANYTDLQASIAGWMNRSDLTSVIPDFVVLAESRISRDLRIRKQVANTTLTTVAGTQSVTLPADFLEIENLTVSSASPPGALSVVTPEIMDRKFPANYQTGQPQVYTIVGDKMLFGPTPDAAYTISLDYYQKLAALSATPTNWLLTNHPMVYLAGSMCEACIYTKDVDGLALWDARYRAEVKQLQDVDDDALRTGSIMRVRTL